MYHNDNTQIQSKVKYTHLLIMFSLKNIKNQRKLGLARQHPPTPLSYFFCNMYNNKKTTQTTQKFIK